MIFKLVLRSFKISTLALLLAPLPCLQAQTHFETASLSLPDEPQSQGRSAQISKTSVQTSSSVSPADQPTSPKPQAPLTNAERKAAAEAELQRELHQRLAGVVPNFNAVLDGNSLPLSAGQKMRASFHAAVDPYQFGLAAFTSLIGQATGSHSSYDAVRKINIGYSQGIVGYSQRLGAGFTDQFDGTIIGNGVLPVLLHQDSRYYRMGTGSFKKRLFYSVGTTIYCKGDNGRWQPNYSNVLGNIASGGISNLYYPEADRGFELTMEQAMTVTAEGAFGAVLIEFYPDIRNHFRKKRRDPTIQNSQPVSTALAPSQTP